MKKLNLLSITSLGLLSLGFMSCATKPVAQSTAAANPYGVPQATTGTQAAYPTTSTTAYPTTASTTPAATSYPSTPAPAPAASSGQSYTIQKGDTLWGISRKFNTSVGALQSANGLSGNTIIAGQTITIP